MSNQQPKTGAYTVMKVLADQGVDIVFGYPGGAVIPLYHEWFHWQHLIKHYRTSHEQHAVHAADGYARASGKVGVCFVTSGPGATNTITGIATAYMDSVPLVVITGQVSSQWIGKDAFQEVDITMMTMSITKHNFRVRAGQSIEGILNKAFEIARSGRPGPVLVDIPKDLLVEAIDWECELESHMGSHMEKQTESHMENEEEDSIEYLDSLETVKQWLQDAKRPLIYSGGGIRLSAAENELVNFAVRFNIPVVNSLMGLGTINRRHPLSLGLVGMHGSREANLAVDSCDLLLAIGVRFSDRVIGNPKEFAKQARIVHMDYDPTEHHKNCLVDLTLTGNIKKMLIHLSEGHLTEHDDWHTQIEETKQTPKQLTDVDHYFNVLNRCDSGNVIYVTDVGQHQMWSAQKLLIGGSRKWLTSGGLGTMGFGLGAAIGAKLAKPDARVVLITGDGSFRMNLHELSTLAEYNIKIDIILMHNGSLGMVRQWQTLFQSCVYAETQLSDCINYELLAEAFGLKGKVVESFEDFETTLTASERLPHSTLTVIPIHEDEKVLPIVPPGMGIAKFIEH